MSNEVLFDQKRIHGTIPSPGHAPLLFPAWPGSLRCLDLVANGFGLFVALAQVILEGSWFTR